MNKKKFIFLLLFRFCLFLLLFIAFCNSLMYFHVFSCIILKAFYVYFVLKLPLLSPPKTSNKTYNFSLVLHKEARIEQTVFNMVPDIMPGAVW